MRTSLTIGGSIDIATTDEVKSIVGDSTDTLSKMFRRSNRKPVRRTIPASIQMPTTGAGILDVGSPPSGSTWCLVDVVVTGNDDHTAVAAATAALYIGDPANVMLGTLLRPGIAIPGSWSFSKEVIFAHFGESIFVSVSGAAAATNLSAVVRVHQYIEDMIEADRI